MAESRQHLRTLQRPIWHKDRMCREGKEITELKTYILKIIYKKSMGTAPKMKKFSFQIENVV